MGTGGDHPVRAGLKHLNQFQLILTLPDPHALAWQGQGHNQTTGGQAIALKSDLADKRFKFRHNTSKPDKEVRLKHTLQKSSFYRYFAISP
jgi:hypothetical protein